MKRADPFQMMWKIMISELSAFFWGGVGLRAAALQLAAAGLVLVAAWVPELPTDQGRRLVAGSWWVYLELGVLLPVAMALPAGLLSPGWYPAQGRPNGLSGPPPDPLGERAPEPAALVAGLAASGFVASGLLLALGLPLGVVALGTQGLDLSRAGGLLALGLLWTAAFSLVGAAIGLGLQQPGARSLLVYSALAALLVVSAVAAAASEPPADRLLMAANPFAVASELLAGSPSEAGGERPRWVLSLVLYGVLGAASFAEAALAARGRLAGTAKGNARWP